MILASHVTKRFDRTLAVDDLSFTVERGQICGFLGPNGAGKTTTLRMLAGFLDPTGGEICLAGRPLTTTDHAARRRIGYLPENCPLYPEMRVDEYLRYRAALKGVPFLRLRRRVDEVKRLCGVSDVGRRVIGNLSKGYRQRVGLADALVHEPEVLLLDEPTIGLDPHQIRQVRDLIRSLAGRHTVLLSSHILTEVEMVCDHVLIINRGRLIASSSVADLALQVQRRARVTAELQAPSADEVRAGIEALEGHPAVRVGTREDGWLDVGVERADGGDLRPELFRCAAARGWALRELHRETPTLEDMFVTLTGDAPPRGEGGAS